MKHRLQTFLKHKLQWLVLLAALLGVSQGGWGTNYYLRGEFNGWGADLLTLDDDGWYKSGFYQIDYNSTNRFKITDNNSWSGEEYWAWDDSPNKGNIACTTGSGDGITIKETERDGFMQIWFNATSKKCAYLFSPFSIAGDMNSWSTDNTSYAMTWDGTYYSLSLGSKSSDNTVTFKVVRGRSWSDASYNSLTSTSPSNYSDYGTGEITSDENKNVKMTFSTNVSDFTIKFSTDNNIYMVCTPSCTTPSITTQPSASQSVCVGSTPTSISVTASGTSLSYQWQSKTDGDWGNLSGKTSNTLTFSTASTSGTTNYRCVVTDACGNTVESNTHVLTVNANPSTPSITSYDEYVCGGAAPTFTFSSTSGLVYQMYVGGSTSGDYITGDGSSQTLTADDIDEETTFTLRATNSTTGCYSSSSGATVGITPDMALTSITLTPSNICVGGTSVASETGLELGGGSIEYTASPAAKVSIDDREITGVAVADGITITATVSGGCGSDPDPKTATLNVKAAPTVYTLSASGESEAYICSAGGTLTLSGSQSGYSYQLKKDGSASGTARTGTGSALEFTVYESGEYTCEAYLTGSPDCKTSMTGTVTLHLSLTPNLLPATPTVKNYEPVTITSINTDIETWTISNAGNTAYLYNITSNSATVKASKANSPYTVTATTPGGCSSTVTVTVGDYTETCN